MPNSNDSLNHTLLKTMDDNRLFTHEPAHVRILAAEILSKAAASYYGKAIEANDKSLLNTLHNEEADIRRLDIAFNGEHAKGKTLRDLVIQAEAMNMGGARSSDQATVVYDNTMFVQSYSDLANGVRPSEIRLPTSDGIERLKKLADNDDGAWVDFHGDLWELINFYEASKKPVVRSEEVGSGLRAVMYRDGVQCTNQPEAMKEFIMGVVGMEYVD